MPLSITVFESRILVENRYPTEAIRFTQLPLVTKN